MKIKRVNKCEGQRIKLDRTSILNKGWLLFSNHWGNLKNLFLPTFMELSGISITNKHSLWCQNNYYILKIKNREIMKLTNSVEWTLHKGQEVKECGQGHTAKCKYSNAGVSEVTDYGKLLLITLKWLIIKEQNKCCLIGCRWFKTHHELMSVVPCLWPLTCLNDILSPSRERTLSAQSLHL